MNIYGYLLLTEGRSLFVRDRADIAWADSDDNYTVKTLVAVDEIRPYVNIKPNVYDGFIQPDFEAYRDGC